MIMFIHITFTGLSRCYWFRNSISHIYI